MNRRENGSTHSTRNGHVPVTGDGDSGATRYENESVPGLVKKLAFDLSTLFSQELALAKAEMASAVKDARSGISSVVVGGSILYAGFLFLLGGVMLLLANWVILPVAALMVGVVVAIIGAILLQTGKRKMDIDTLKPDRTMEAVRKDAELVKRKAK